MPMISKPAYVALVGGANMDISAISHAPPIAGDSNPGRILCSPGGVARNVAENLLRLGIDARLLSVLGDDVFGLALRQAAGDIGLDLGACVTITGRRSATYLSLHGPDGDMGVAVNDMDILECLTPELMQTHSGLLAGAVALVVDCNLRTDVIQWLCAPVGPDSAGARAGHPVLFAEAVSVAKCGKLLPVLPHLHTLKANRMEAMALGTPPITSAQTAMDAALNLHQRGVRNVVISLGADGAAWCDAQGATGYRAVRPVQMASATGAGDALLSGLVYGYLHAMPLDLAVPWAMACAELTLSSTLANSPDLSAAAVKARLQAQDL
jgi:pseudouridine kinase